MKKGLILLVLAIALAPSPSYARVVRFVIEEKLNLDKAPRNARGMVEFSSPFVILRVRKQGHRTRPQAYAVGFPSNSARTARAFLA